MNGHRRRTRARRIGLGLVGGLAGAAVGWILAVSLGLDLATTILACATVFFVLTLLFEGDWLDLIT